MTDIGGMRIPMLAKVLFWPAASIAFVLAVLPQGSVNLGETNDKLQHMLAFFTLAVLGRLAFPAAKPAVVGAALAALGGAIEIVQMIPWLHRDAEWMDFFADCGAIIVGLAVGSAVLQLRVVRDPSPSAPSPRT